MNRLATENLIKEINQLPNGEPLNFKIKKTEKVNTKKLIGFTSTLLGIDSDAIRLSRLRGRIEFKIKRGMFSLRNIPQDFDGRFISSYGSKYTFRCESLKNGAGYSYTSFNRGTTKLTLNSIEPTNSLIYFESDKRGTPLQDKILTR